MASGTAAFLLLEGHCEKVARTILRDCSNPFEVPETAFLASYRLNKEAFREVLNAIEGHLQRSKIPPLLQLAATLRFLDEGSYQRSIGKDSSISFGRSTVSIALNDVLTAIERYVCPQWIKIEMDSNEKCRSRNYFYSKYKIPSTIGCIDGTHVKIVKPSIDQHLYYKQKRYFSMNAMIICDGDMKIRAVDARYPGSSHESFVWNLSIFPSKL